MEDLQPHHPYSPASAPLSHYAENELPLPVVVGSLGLMLSAVAGLSIIWAAKRNPGLALAEKCTVAWFAICEPLFPCSRRLLCWDAADLDRWFSTLLL